MRITKEILQRELYNCRQERDRLVEDNKVLEAKLKFLAGLVPNSSMIIAMERITEALAHTIRDLKRR